MCCQEKFSYILLILVYLLASCKCFITLTSRAVITYWGYSIVYTNLSCIGINAWRFTELFTGPLNAFLGLNYKCFFLSDTLICWNREMPVPWNEPSADVELELWTMLSIAAVVETFLQSDGGHTTLYCFYWRKTLFSKTVESSRTPL